MNIKAVNSGMIVPVVSKGGWVTMLTMNRATATITVEEAVDERKTKKKVKALESRLLARLHRPVVQLKKDLGM